MGGGSNSPFSDRLLENATQVLGDYHQWLPLTPWQWQYLGIVQDAVLCRAELQL